MLISVCAYTCCRGCLKRGLGRRAFEGRLGRRAVWCVSVNVLWAFSLGGVGYNSVSSLGVRVSAEISMFPERGWGPKTGESSSRCPRCFTPVKYIDVGAECDASQNAVFCDKMTPRSALLFSCRKRTLSVYTWFLFPRKIPLHERCTDFGDDTQRGYVALCTSPGLSRGHLSLPPRSPRSPPKLLAPALSVFISFV